MVHLATFPRLGSQRQWQVTTWAAQIQNVSLITAPASVAGKGKLIRRWVCAKTGARQWLKTTSYCFRSDLGQSLRFYETWPSLPLQDAEDWAYYAQTFPHESVPFLSLPELNWKSPCTVALLLLPFIYRVPFWYFFIRCQLSLPLLKLHSIDDSN